jgi:NADH:ubiquinone oxidoreductase subunit E
VSLQITRGGSSEGSNPGGSIELAKANAIMERYTTWNADEALIPMLQEIQHEYGYIPDVLTALISETFEVPLAQIYGVATFYSDFRGLPQADHRVLLCEGLACYVCGSQELHRAVKEKLGIEYGQTTPDNKFILERANYCFGACQLMPMVEIDHTFYGNVTPERLLDLIDQTARGEGHSSHE